MMLEKKKMLEKKMLEDVGEVAGTQMQTSRDRDMHRERQKTKERDREEDRYFGGGEVEVDSRRGSPLPVRSSR